MDNKRRGIVVWFQHRKNLKVIKRFGNLIYVSRKLKYALLYINEDSYEKTKEKLQKYSFVSKVDESYRPFLRTEYENALPDEAKQYDYKVGI